MSPRGPAAPQGCIAIEGYSRPGPARSSGSSRDLFPSSNVAGGVHGRAEPPDNPRCSREAACPVGGTRLWPLYTVGSPSPAGPTSLLGMPQGSPSQAIRANCSKCSLFLVPPSAISRGSFCLPKWESIFYFSFLTLTVWPKAGTN